MNLISLFSTALLLFITLSAQQCGGNATGGAGAALPQALWGVWVHSHEEDYGGNEVYRNPDYDFPPSRGREKFDIKDDGELMYYGMAANDAHGQEIRGQWRAMDARNIEVFFPGKELEAFGLELVEITPSRLVVKRLVD